MTFPRLGRILTPLVERESRNVHQGPNIIPPDEIIARGTDWRYFNELKRELKEG